MNSRALSDKAKNVAKKYNVTSNLIINHFFFDSIIKRISYSKYKSNFILKGGFLLSINLGIKSRTTNDLDFLIILFLGDVSHFDLLQWKQIVSPLWLTGR